MKRADRSSLFPGMAWLACVLLLGGCGGGGGGGGGNPMPANRAPSITSPATASVAENSTGTIYTATATDPDGNALTFSLSGGADRAAFAIGAAGALSFVQTPDFEVPTDADGNNVYLVQIAVSDGQTSAVLDVAITVTNVGPDGFRVNRIATGFVQPVFLMPAPGNIGGSSNPLDPIRVFVVERGGNIYLFTPSDGTRPVFLNLSSILTTNGEGGLLGMAMAPDYASSGFFYVYLTNPAGDIEVRRYRSLTGNRLMGAFSTGDVILTIPHPTFNNHYGGWIGFGPDGFLYIAVGDGGGGGDQSNNAQNTNVLLGKMLRIDPATDSFPADPLRDYAIPPGNPFATAGGRPEIWAYGLRNPFRASFDPLTQNLWIGDVGENAREEIDLMRPTDGGANFGWRLLEGTAQFAGPAPANAVPPVAEYLHGPGPREGFSVTGGIVYRGPVEALRGQYIFGDFINTNIWSLPIAQVSIGSTLGSDRFILRRTDFTPPQGNVGNMPCFGVDLAGNLYIVDFDGEIYRLDAL